VLGVDACRGGWVAIELNGGAFAGARFAATLGELTSGDHRVVGVDMPLGLLDAGWREADRLAAAYVGPRRGSVFPVPPRAVWEPDGYAEANALCRELTGGGLSRQTFGLRAKLRQANALWYADDRLFEVHPEVSFRELAGAPVAYPKTTWNGVAIRRTLLALGGVALPDDLAAAGRAAPDDILDAAAVAWSAHRIATGTARSLPDPPQPAAGGREIAIWR
jgi:predicted RNase H-like nuclease